MTIWLLAATSINPANAATVILNSSIGSGCVQAFASGYIYTNRYVATRSIEISAINFLIGTQSSANVNSTQVLIYTDSPTVNSPDALIATFTPDAIYGSNETTTARFIGNQSIAAGSKFWIVPSVRANLLPRCYYPSANVSQMTLNGVVPDTSTTGSNSSFARAYSTAMSPPNAGAWTATNSPQIWQLSIEAQLIPVSASIGLQNGSTKGLYRVTTPVAVSVNTPSKVTFYARAKVIPNCRNILSASGVATCNWKPSMTGSVTITARVTPLDSSSANPASVAFHVSVSKRNNFR